MVITIHLSGNYSLDMQHMRCAQVRRIQKAIKPWSFDRLHGAFTSITEGGADAVQRSADRIVGILDGTMQREYF